MSRSTRLRHFRWVFTVVPFLGLALTAIAEFQPVAPDSLQRGLLYVGFVMVFVGEGIALLAWAHHFMAEGNTLLGKALIRGIFAILLAFVGWSVLFTSTPIPAPSLAGLEALIVGSSLAAVGVLLLVASSHTSFPAVLTDRTFGLVVFSLAILVYSVQITITDAWNLLTFAILIFLVGLLCIRILQPKWIPDSISGQP